MARRSRRHVTRARLWAGTVCLMLFGLAGFAIAAGLNEAVLAKFAEQEKQYQLPSGILAKVAKVESGGNATAGNPAHAFGLFQWLPNSWYGASKALYGSPKDPVLRTNPFISSEVTAFSFAQTKAQLGMLIKQANVDEITGIYLGHFLGPAGAKKFLQNLIANPNGIAASTFSREANANKAIFYNNGNARTYTELTNHLASKLKVPGISGVTGYNGIYADSTQAGRIMDAQGAAGLSQSYSAPAPAQSDFTYPADYSAPLPQSMCQPQFLCNGSAVVARDSSCTYRTVQVCQYGCTAGACVATPPILQQQQQQLQCPPGSLPSNGQCIPLQQQLPQSQQPFSGSAGQTSDSTGSAVSSGSATQSSTGLGLSASDTATSGTFSSVGSFLDQSQLNIGNTGPGGQSISLLDSLTTDQSSLAPNGGSQAGFGTPAPVGSGFDVTGSLSGGQTGLVSAGPGIGAGETFTSPDLKDLPVAGQESGDATTGLVAQTLTSLKQALLRAWDFLLSIRSRLSS